MADLNWMCNVFFGYFLCAKESNPRASAEKIPGFQESTWHAGVKSKMLRQSIAQDHRAMWPYESVGNRARLHLTILPA
jgi:hypothetical protein